ncbi:MAG: right-handed parallel beta-helix repeat-containing protein, partial [Bacteroidota bacterium]
IYLFGEVTINPDEPVSSSPFVIQDELIFETNGNTQSVTLEAWGQNANYIPSRFGKGGVALLSCDLNEVVWDDPKPYVIYGVLVIDSCTLRIPAGTQIYVHGGIARTFDENEDLVVYNDGLIFALPQGKLQVEGTLEDPVVFQGDRLEEPFGEVPGQWVGIRLASQGNTFTYTEVKNSLLGVLVDSAAQLSLKNTQIYNTSGPGLVGQHANIDATNCLFHNNGSFSVQLGYGGDYTFDYCTLASFGVDAPALSLSNGICYDPLCQSFDIYRLNAAFRNSIVYGSRRDEISLSDFTAGMDPGSFNISLEDCLVRVEELLDPDEGGYPDFLLTQCSPCINAGSSDPVFANVDEDDYQLDTLSLAEGQALPITGILKDLIENDRDTQTPDIGCFEYQYE